ncbi:MAG: transcription-repair coupling factor [Proteobacteria bacterium]|nr:transcription-repair coupling factor [Pseudomonadota bacterium]
MSVVLCEPSALAAPSLAGLPEGALAYAVSRLPGARVVVAPDAAEAYRLVAELEWHGRKAMQFPADDTRPYEGLSPHPDMPRARIEAQAALARGEDVVVVAPAPAVLLRVLSNEVLTSGPELVLDGTIDPSDLGHQLAALGYLGVGKVEDPGTYAVRGEVVDVWATGHDGPMRIEFFDDEIERMRAFDPETGKPLGEPLERVSVLPAREEVLGPVALARLDVRLAECTKALGYGQRLAREIVEDLSDGIRFSGCDAWLPAFQDLASLFDQAHLPWLIAEPEQCFEAMRTFEDRAVSRHAAVPDSERPLVGPHDRYVPVDEALERLAGATHVHTLAVDETHDLGARDNTFLATSKGDLAPTVGRIDKWLADDWRVAIVADTTSRMDRLRQLFLPHGLVPHNSDERDPSRWPPGQLQLLRGDLPRGFHDPDARVALVTSDEILGEKVKVRMGRRRQMARQGGIGSFAELKEGDLVVHDRHGVGKYRGLSRVDLGTGPQDMVRLEYRGGDRMYLPVVRLDQLYRYRSSGGGVEPRLDKLGGETWQIRKARVKEAVLRFAAELVKLQASRQVHPGHAYDVESERLRTFEDGFAFVETEDQAKAIHDVLQDLAKPEPMDRLIVGDAGFGKTEVAMRAAFAVVDAGKQVSLLCPTTVLAFQHQRTLQERFAPFGVKVGLLSRFGSPAQEKELKKQLKSGEVQIVVGTTRLLGRTIRFKELGLIVVDEEHRFGVSQKEKLKRLRSEVDYLAMSATPIPRSLHMAMSGLRGISIISTPPLDRLPVHTLVARHTPARLREEILRELKRGGQVFLVHNRIATIEVMARAVREAVPEASLEIAHGQMDDAPLEDVLVRFVQRRFDVLVCTSIIESGVDMPNVNTILVNQPDKFGLAQLYQLRGRVGRSHRRGYCTLLIEEGRDLTRKAMQRLRVLQEHTRLGSGFAVATADLELRGAGDLLGDKQHGHIESIGFEAYMALLDEAVAEARGSQARRRIEPEIEVRAPAWLPEAYIPEVDHRLSIYKALSSADSLPELRALLDRIEGERGELPDEAHNLGRLLEVKLRARDLGILKMSVLQIRVVVEFAEVTTVTPERIVELARKMPRRLKVGDGRVEVRFTPEEGRRPFLFLHWVCDLFAD